MAPSTSPCEGVACDWPHAARTIRRASAEITSRRISASLGGRGLLQRKTAPRFGQLPIELVGRRVPVVDVQGAAVGGHDDRGWKRVHVEAVGKLPLGDGVDLVDAYAPELRQRRLLVCPAYGAVVAGEIKDVRLGRRRRRRARREAPSSR